MEQQGKPDPLVGSGPLKTIFASATGLDDFLEARGKRGIEKLLSNAAVDPKISLGKWIRSGYANVTSVGAGKFTRNLLTKLSPICAGELVPTIFGCSRNDLLSMSDRDLGRKAKEAFRMMDQTQCHAAATQLLGNCESSPVTASRS